MKRSEQVMEWQAEAKVEAKADDVIKVLRLRFGKELPAEREQHIRASTELDQLDRWLAATRRGAWASRSPAGRG